MIKKFIQSTILFLLVNLTIAVVPASVDRTTTQVGDTLTLSIDVSNTSDTPQIDVLHNNFVILGTSNSSQMSIINGHMNSQKSIMVTISPKNPGTQQIPSIKVGNDATNPITINVTKTAQLVKPEGKTDTQVFVDVSLDKANTYNNIPVVYDLKLYFNVPLNNLSMANFEIPNAQIKPLGKNTQYQTNYHGKAYEVVEQKLLITPNKAGNIEIPSAKISGMILDRNPNNFFSTPNNFNIQSKPLSLNVLPSPSTNLLMAKSLDISDSWSPNDDRVTMGDPITRTITIKANGVPYNVIPELNLDTPKGVNAYPDKTITDTSISGDKLIGEKTFRIVYIPTGAGIIKFPETKIKWWDIDKKIEKMYVLESKSYGVISDGKATTMSSGVVTSPKPTLKPNKIKTSIKWWLYIVLIIVLIIILALVILWKKFSPHHRSKQQNYILLKKAIKSKDIKALNHALISWASIYSNKKVYTISDIKEFIDNKTLHELIDKLNLALYKGYPFDEFDVLFKEINNISKTKGTNTHEFLKNLYPE